MNDTKQCPDCDSQIAVRAASCKCGWRADLAKEMRESQAAAARANLQCFMQDCPYPGLLVVNGKRTCVVHHDAALRPSGIRVPGSDDEPVAHA